jgi:nucleotide-binding universal stress UspA family protein
MYRRIPVAIDDSDTSARGLDEAIEPARDTAARPCIMHVIEPLTLAMYPEAAAQADDLFGMLRDSGKALVQRVCAKAAKRSTGRKRG